MMTHLLLSEATSLHGNSIRNGLSDRGHPYEWVTDLQRVPIVRDLRTQRAKYEGQQLESLRARLRSLLT